MKTIEVFDPAMCCSTGVCGPTVDPALASFAAALEWIATLGIVVKRYNFAQEPGVFAKNKLVKKRLAEKANDCLPLILIDGKIGFEGKYPDRRELGMKLGLETGPRMVGLDSQEVKHLIAIGASIAANGMACFKYHFNQALNLGLTREEIAPAVNAALTIKQKSGEPILKLADRHLFPDESGGEGSSGCCGGHSHGDGGGCCGNK